MDKRHKFKGVNSIKFANRFSSDEACIEYISLIKWENGFQCKRCGHTNYCKGKQPFSRRCTKCKHDESALAGTLFDRCKIPLQVAFHIAFRIGCKKKGMSSLELSHEFELRQKTCWVFKTKLQDAMKSSGAYKLTGEVHVDEFFVGGEEEGVIGREKGKKKLVIAALEIVNDGFGRAYAQVIKDASSESFKPFFEKYIDKDAYVITDEWKGYLPLKSEFPNLTQKPSKDGSSFPQMHIHIMNIKGWLRGIHHHCSEERLQGYLDEYHFRFNRRNNMDTIFDVLMRRMVKGQPIRKRLVKNSSAT